MSNPNNALGTNAAFGGRTSVNAFNDVLGTFNGPGILSGWGCSPSSGLTVTLGGNGTVRDVAIAEDSAGNRTTINNISKSPISVTMDAAPASNSRIDAIVAYIESSPSSNALTDNPDVVNLLVVDGTAASTPTAPNDSAIRTAITADGAAGTTAYYVVLAYITIASGTTDIDNTMIASGGMAGVGSRNIDFTTLWPVGSYYETSDLNFDPNVSWGGTWLQDSVGRVTIGYDSTDSDFNSTGKTGGSKTHYHITGANIGTTDIVAGQGVCARNTNDTSTTKALPPYVVVVRWHRTA